MNCLHFVRLFFIKGEIMSLHTNEKYKQMIKDFSKKSPCLKNCVCAFLVGGLLCFLGQWLFFLYSHLGMDEEGAGTLVTVSLIFLSAALTAVGVFDRIARVAGAGTLLPVTGFANAVVSPALDTKNEGPVLGVGAKIFTIAGPVLLFGIFAGCVYGVIYALCGWLL